MNPYLFYTLKISRHRLLREATEAAYDNVGEVYVVNTDALLAMSECEDDDENIHHTPEEMKELRSEDTGDLENIYNQDDGDYQKVDQLTHTKKKQKIGNPQ